MRVINQSNTKKINIQQINKLCVTVKLLQFIQSTSAEKLQKLIHKRIEINQLTKKFKVPIDQSIINLKKNSSLSIIKNNTKFKSSYLYLCVYIYVCACVSAHKVPLIDEEDDASA